MNCFFLSLLKLSGCFSIALGAALALVSRSTLAQVVPDGTLASEVSRLEAQSQRDVVVGGAARGGVLFHSFEQLNVGEGRSLYFANPNGIAQIFSRVTGNQRSEILGTLGVLGNADLYLLNPNGVLFGPKAQLDLSGSFAATTAATVKVAGLELSAVSPAAAPTANSMANLADHSTAGLLMLQANHLYLKDSYIMALTTGDRNGADLVIDVQNEAILRNSAARAFAANGSRGNAGDLTVRANRLVLFLPTAFRDSIPLPPAAVRETFALRLRI